jgi:DNA polymerase
MSHTTGIERPGADRWVPDAGTLPELRLAAIDCRGCELWADATQVVFSSGPANAPLVLVGEQPGDREDIEGQPFVGPAGRVLADAVDSAGIDRSLVYVTNAVKHFRFQQRGKRRLHATPEIVHIDACRPWLDAELRAICPRVVVCLGATAGRAVLGRAVKIGAERGRPIRPPGMANAPGIDADVIVTTHPSAVLRLRGREGFDEAFDALVADLAEAARLLDAPN